MAAVAQFTGEGDSPGFQQMRGVMLDFAGVRRTSRAFRAKGGYVCQRQAL